MVSLTADQIDKLWAVLDPKAKDNPFKSKFVRYRNSLLITMMIFLGTRRGEALGLRLCDIHWSDAAVEVVRRQDNKNEKRKSEPKQKTRERDIPASTELLMAVLEYIQDPGLRPKHAKQGNKSLFVARNGDPLTKSGVQKIFERIRNRSPDFPTDFSAHICRHTANYILTKAFDAQGLSQAERDVLRRQFNGWSDTSSMPALYNRRDIEEKARASVLRGQEDFSRRAPKRGPAGTEEVKLS